MRVVFIVERENYYRTFGPIVDAALKRGWDVECWHDWAQPRWGPKGADFPDSSPLFSWGCPQVVIYQGGEELVELLRKAPPDAVVAPWPPPPAVEQRATWICVQHMMNLVHFGLEGVLRFDRVAGNSQFWLDQTWEYFRASGALRTTNAAAAEELSRKFTVVGVPEFDQVKAIDPSAVRARLGLPSDRPVVLYLPYPVKSNPQTFWLRHVYSPQNRVRRGLAVLTTLHFRYWRHVAHDWCDVRVVEAVRAFCDANNALLVVKSRFKDPVPPYTQKRADLVMYDECYYPATILELLAISSLCVHFFSSTVCEAVFLGVPSLCLAPAPEDMGLSSAWSETLCNVREGGVYHFPGASYYLSLPELFEELPRRSFKNFALDPLARARFVEKFLGFDDARSSERLLDLIEAARGDR